MSPERWKQIKKILDDVHEVPASERDAFLQKASGGDPELLRELKSFLAFDEDLSTFIPKPVFSLSPGSDKNVGRRIGHYRLGRPLGQGGMGSVYLAVREDDFKQKAALKLIHPGMHSGQILARFLNERQILAQLEHPNIARLLDGGTTDEGLPYFVLEYVDGEPIDEYCTSRRLSVDERLELFRQVSAAVHFAHQNLVVHRDLKPSNILITSTGMPKLLDFGIAKILGDTKSQGVETVPGHGPMTPNYASPEQVMDKPVTTVSDVYSLGVLLYRLLADASPYELGGTGYAEMLRTVCHDEPVPPSVAARRRAMELSEKKAGARDGSGRGELRRRGRRLAGDLDAIVLKAMRKEPQQRYSSAEQLSDDLRRHRSRLPVLARRGNWSYRAGKFVRRHKVVLAAVVLVFAFAVSTTVLWREAVEGQSQAERERNRSQALFEFLNGLFMAADPKVARGEDWTVLELLDRGQQQLAERLEDDLDIRAELLGTLGTVYNNLGRYEKARENKLKVLQIRRQLHPEGDAELAKGLVNLARLSYDLGDYDQAESYYREALEMKRELGQSDEETVRTLSSLATTLTAKGAYEEAEKLHLEAFAIRVQHGGPQDINVASSLHRLGMHYYTRGMLDKAESYLLRAQEIYQLYYESDPRGVASVLSSLGNVYRSQGDLEKSESHLKRALEIRQRLLKDRHRDVADSKKDLAKLLLSQGETTSAGVLLYQALPVLRRVLPKGHWSLADAEGALGEYLSQLGCHAEAEPYLLHSYAVVREAKGEDALQTEEARARLLALYEAWGLPEAAAPFR